MVNEIIFKSRLQKFEGLPGTGGSTNYMYLDTEQNITIGYGCMLASVEEAKKLNFVHKDNPAITATAQEIEDSYKAIKKITNVNFTATHYEDIKTGTTNLILPDEAVTQLFDERYTKAKTQLKTYFPLYDKYPKSVQFALIDMCFNLGMGGEGKSKGLWGQFVKPGRNFGKAIEDHEWKKAAENSSRRPPVPDERNKYVFDLLMQADAEDKLCPPTIGINEIPKRHPVPKDTKHSSLPAKKKSVHSKSHTKHGSHQKSLTSHHHNPIQPLSGPAKSTIQPLKNQHGIGHNRNQ